MRAVYAVEVGSPKAREFVEGKTVDLINGFEVEGFERDGHPGFPEVAVEVVDGAPFDVRAVPSRFGVHSGSTEVWA